MQANWIFSDPPQLVLFKQAAAYYSWGTSRGMASQPAPNPQDTELVLMRKIVNYTAFIAGAIT